LHFEMDLVEDCMGAEGIEERGNEHGISRRRVLSAAGLAAVAVPLSAKGAQATPTLLKTPDAAGAPQPGRAARPAGYIVPAVEALNPLFHLRRQPCEARLLDLAWSRVPGWDHL
jgi:hypothetical protein